MHYGVGWRGESTDKPAPGDYDGGGKTDIAGWRPENGYGYILGSKDGVIWTQCGAGWLNEEPISQ